MSINFQDFFNQLNLINNSENFYKFKKIFKEHGFIGFNVNPSRKLVEHNEMFIENSPYCRSTIKRTLIRGNVIDYKCAGCGNTGNWKDKLLILQLEHKNGLGNDNRLENLEFLCPNCHSQTPTFAARNKQPTNAKNKEINTEESDSEIFERKHRLVQHKPDKLQECKKYAKSKNGECLSDFYYSYNTKLKWKCSNPEHSVWHSDWTHVVKRKRWCPECNGGIKNKNGLQVAKNHAEKKGGECLSDKYINSDIKLEWKCSNINYSSWFANFHQVINKGTWCPSCAGRLPKEKMLKQAQKHAEEKNGKCLSEEYKKAIEKLEWKCTNPDHDSWFATYHGVVNGGYWCPQCGNDKKKQKKIN